MSSGEKWGRGPTHDIHSSLKACVDSPAWRLVHALNTLVSADGNTPAIPGFADKARPLSAAEDLGRRTELLIEQEATEETEGIRFLRFV